MHADTLLSITIRMRSFAMAAARHINTVDLGLLVHAVSIAYFTKLTTIAPQYFLDVEMW